jgi:hypothetical protein
MIKGTPVTDVPVELSMEVARWTDVITVIKRLWHLIASSVSIAAGKLLDWRVGVAYCSRHHPVRTCSGAQPTSYSVSTVGSSPGVKRPGSKFCFSLHLVSRVRMSGAIPLLPMCSYDGYKEIFALNVLHFRCKIYVSIFLEMTSFEERMKRRCLDPTITQRAK